jgi:hypothetical protein
LNGSQYLAWLPEPVPQNLNQTGHYLLQLQFSTSLEGFGGRPRQLFYGVNGDSEMVVEPPLRDPVSTQNPAAVTRIAPAELTAIAVGTASGIAFVVGIGMLVYKCRGRQRMQGR